MSHVQVVIVNWNGREYLGDCLRAVLAQRFAGTVAPLVIDNGSTDGSVEFLAADFPQVPCRQHPNNYTAANNLGVELAPGPYALLLNTDATPRPDCVAQLVAALAADPLAAAAGPRIVYPDGRLASTGIAQRDDLYWYDRDDGKVDPGTVGPPEEVLGVSGCCLLVRTDAWRRVGGEDPAFHMYYEDVDLALNLRAAGFRSLHVPAAVCVHVGHGSIRKTTTGKDAIGERNRLLVLARHFRDRFGAAAVRSPWFQSCAPGELRELLPHLAARLGGPPEVAMAALVLALRDEVRGLAGELDAAFGTHRNLPALLQERERWIAMLLEEVARLRLWRLPGRRLKPDERAFLDRVRGRQPRS